MIENQNINKPKYLIWIIKGDRKEYLNVKNVTLYIKLANWIFKYICIIFNTKALLLLMSSIIIKHSRISNPITLAFKKAKNQQIKEQQFFLNRFDEEITGDTLIKLANEGVSKSIRESKALGLSITYAENGIIYQEEADGTRIEIGRISE